MKTVLAALNSKFIHSNLAIRYIKEYCSNDDVLLFEASINENLLDTAARIMDMEPEIAAFSCYIWNIEETLKLCSTIKRINKDIIIILGGPEVTYDSLKVLENNDYIDFIVNGEGEIIFKNLLDAFETGKGFEGLKGITYRSNNKIIKNEDEKLIDDLDIIPFPYNDDDLPEKIVYYEASRGCPFNCSYCLSSTIKGVRYFSINKVKRDLKYFIDRDVKLVKFVDRTFNANRKFAVEIWQYLIENFKNTRFHFEIAADIIDENMIEVLKKAPEGLFQFEIGVQTTNPEILKNINRIMDFDIVSKNIKLIKKNCNIHCHLDLIAGLPGENINSFKRSFNMCMDLRPDVLQLGFLKVLKGSPISRETSIYDIKSISYPPYHVLSTDTMSFNELKELLQFEKVFEVFYNSGIFYFTIKYLLSNNKDAFEFFENLYIFAVENNFFVRNFNLIDKCQLLYNFGIGFNEEALIKDLLIHDLIINTKKPYIPLFLNKSIDNDFKTRISESKEIIIKKFEIKDTKTIFSIPVSIQICNRPEKIEIKKLNSIAVFNLQDSEYFYI
jgi:radical SAM superfamily enzyme YgiQ (UPF0313 family)